MNSFRERQQLLLLALFSALVGLLVLTGTAGADRIDDKRAEAEQALEQIQQMDIKLEQAVERYNGAVYYLSKTTANLNRTRAELKISRRSLNLSRRALARRAIAVYQEQGSASNSTVAILLQATSLEDMVDRLEAAQRISDHDTQVVHQVEEFTSKVAARKASLEKMQERQRRLVAQKEAERNAIESKIAERKAYVRSVKREIASLIEEQKRQDEIAEARARRTVASYSADPVVVETPVIGSAPSSSIGAAVVQAAMSRLGMPYVWAAAGPTSFDCSGLVVWSFAQAGMPGMPHSSYVQMNGGVAVAASDLQPGDLVFFNGGGHVGIYVGGGQFVHAPHTGAVVSVSSLGGHGGFIAARRYGT